MPQCVPEAPCDSPGLVDDRCDLHLTRSHSAESSSPRCDLRLSRSVSAETSTSAHSTVQSSVRSSSSAAAPAPPTPTAPPPSPRAASPRASRYLGLGSRSLSFVRSPARPTTESGRDRSIFARSPPRSPRSVEIGAFDGRDVARSPREAHLPEEGRSRSMTRRVLSSIRNGLVRSKSADALTRRR